MRYWLLLLLCVLVPSTAAARAKVDVSGSPFDAIGSAVVKTWSCEDTLLDTRSRKGIGFAACLRGLASDSLSGRSTAIVELLLDSNDPLDVSELKIELRLDSGRTERTLEAFDVAAAHIGPAARGYAELFLPEWLEPTLPTGKQEDERQHLTIAWNFQTWDPSIPFEFIQLRVAGGGMAGKARWAIPDGLGHDGPWEAQPEVLWDAGWDEAACSVWRVRRSDAKKASEALSEGANTLPMQMRFEVLSQDEDGEFEVNFPDHGFRVVIAGGKLKVRGREDFTHPLGDQWLVGDVPNLVELVYDGEFVTVRVNDDVFGPMAGKRKERKRFRWELAFEDSKNEVRDLQVAPCTLKDPEAWAAPTPKQKDEPAPTERTAAATATPATGPAATPAPTSSKQYGPPGPSATGGAGKVIWAVLYKNGQTVNEVRKKRKKSALEIMTTAASVGQGLAATGQGLSQFGSDVKTNLDAAESGDYDKMKSSSTRVETGPCGSSVTRSEARVTGTETGNPTVEMQGSRTNYNNPGCVDGRPIADSLPVAEINLNLACTLTLSAEERGEVRVGAEALGTMRAGDEWILLLAPGQHVLRHRGRKVGLLRAGAGEAVSVALGETASSMPVEALDQ